MTHTLTKEQVEMWLAYDPDTGALTWLKSPAANVKVGQRAGNRNTIGYQEVRVCNVRTYAHRIAFLLMTGRMPKYVDHINRDKGDNRWCNLRPCTQSQNVANSVQKKQKSGARGVEKTCSGYFARIRHKGKRHYLGHFPTIEEARAAYEKKARELFGEFMCQND